MTKSSVSWSISHLCPLPSITTLFQGCLGTRSISVNWTNYTRRRHGFYVIWPPIQTKKYWYEDIFYCCLFMVYEGWVLSRCRLCYRWQHHGLTICGATDGGGVGVVATFGRRIFHASHLNCSLRFITAYKNVRYTWLLRTCGVWKQGFSVMWIYIESIPSIEVYLHTYYVSPIRC